MDHPTRRHRLSIARESFKFSCAHMTVFPDGSKERLHGHNYFAGVGVELLDIAFAHMVAFAPIKVAMAALSDGLRERTSRRRTTRTSIVHDSALEPSSPLRPALVLPRQDACPSTTSRSRRWRPTRGVLAREGRGAARRHTSASRYVTESPAGRERYPTDEGGSAAPRGR